MAQSISFDIIARDKASATFNKVAASSEKSHRTLARFSKLAAIGIAGVGAALGTAGAIGIKTAAGLQQAQIGFETMLGSGKKARAFLGDLQKFAAKTPFEMPGLIENSRMLIGVGVDAKKVIPLLRDFGDAAGALGIPQESFNRAMLAMSQSISAGKIKLGDMNQLMNAGLPIWQLLAKAVGKPVPEIQKMISHGELLTKDVLPKLQAVMHKDYGGAMARQSQTLSGLWSTLMDTMNIGLANALMPLVPMFQKVMPAAIGAMGTALGKVPGFIAKIGDIASPIAKRIHDAVPTIKARLGEWRDAFTHSLEGVKIAVEPVIDSIRSALDSGNWGPVGKSLGGAMVKALQGAGSVAGRLADSLDKLFKKVDWVGLGIAIGKQAPALVLGLAAGILNFDFGGLLKGLGKHWQDIIVAIVAVAFTPGKIIGKVGEQLARIPLVGKMLQWALVHFKAFSDGLVGMVGRALAFMGRAFVEGFRRVFPTVGKAFSEALKLLPTRVGVMALDLQAKGLQMMRRFGSAIGRGIGGVVAKVGELIARMLKPFAGAGGWLVGKGADVMRGLGSGVRSAAGAVFGFFRNIGGRVLRAVGDLSKVLWNAGASIIQGLIGGISSRVGALVGKLKDITKMIPRLKGPIDKDRKLLEPAGRAIMDGLLSGIEGRRMKVAKALSKVTAMFEAARDKVSSLGDIRSGFLSTFSADSLFGADMSNGGGIGALIGFQQRQAQQASQLMQDIRRVASMGLSKSLIAQLQSAGTSGAEQLHALAGGNISQIRLLNSLNARTQSSLQAAGMFAGNFVRGGSINADISRAQSQAQALQEIVRELKRMKDDGVVEVHMHLDGETIVKQVKARNRRKGVRTAGL